MIEQIKDELSQERDDFRLTTPRLRKHVYYLLGEVERKDRALEELEADMIHRFQMMELKIAEQRQALEVVRDTLAHKKNDDRTSWGLWDVANNALNGDETK